MTKHEIIEILEKCLADYENAVGQMQLRETEIFNHLTIARSFNVHIGFCCWLCNCDLEYLQLLDILKELIKELETRYDYTYWYEPFNLLDVYKTSLIPRIEHLKRTINRLKTEIQNDTNN